MFQGADSDALDALAAQMAEAAEGLDRIGVAVRSRLYNAPWQGGDADCFRQDWDGPHRVRLTSAALRLRGAAELLHRNAADQRLASGSDGGALAGIVAGGILGGIAGGAHGGAGGGAVGGAAPTGGGALAWWERARDLGLVGWNVVDGTVEIGGKYLISNADELARLEKLVKWGDFTIEFSQAAGDQLVEDAGGEYSAGEMAFRSVAAGGTAAAIDLGLDKGGAVIGAYVGTFIPVPVLGTVVGAAIGFGIGTGAEWLMENTGATEWFIDRAVSGASVIYDGVTTAVDFGGEVLDAGADIWDSGTDLASDAWDAGSDLASDAGAAASEFVGGAAEAAGDLFDSISPWD